MLTLRCTRKLLKRMPGETCDETAGPTTTLGDWYANLLILEKRWLVLCTSERTLLSVLLPAREFRTLRARFRDTVLTMLREIGVPEEKVRAEAAEMARIELGRTASRRILGSMNDFAEQCRWRLYESPDASPEVITAALAGVPCGPLDYAFPRDATRAVFGAV